MTVRVSHSKLFASRFDQSITSITYCTSSKLLSEMKMITDTQLLDIARPCAQHSSPPSVFSKVFRAQVANVHILVVTVHARK